MVDSNGWPVHHFRAMGCQMSVRLATEPAAATEALALAERWIGEVERTASRFDPQSELSRLNDRAGRWVAVSPLLWALLEAALAMAEETNGAFDPTLLHAVRAAGYRRSFAAMGDGPIRAEALPPPVADFRAIRRRATSHELWLPTGVGLDFGGIAKGWAAQRLVEALRFWGPALVDAGGDIVAGEAPPGGNGWPVAVAAPSPNAEGEAPDIATLWLENAALATSGIDFRRWTVGEDEAHHIVDPRTGRPAATDLLTVTVLDPSAARAEAWATATLVRGKQRGAAQLAARGMAALLIDADHRAAMTAAMGRYVIEGRAAQSAPGRTKWQCSA